MASMYTTTGLPPVEPPTAGTGNLPRLRPSKTVSKIHSDEEKRNIDMLDLYTLPDSVADPDPGPF